MTRTGTWEWDQYWQSARLAACDGEGGRNYDPSIQDAWRAFFRELGDGRTVLDVATGNGAVALLARDVARDKHWRWTVIGIDSARIEPDKHLAGAGIDVGGVRFLGNTPAERLPFDSASIQVVTSQYGVEYTDVDASVGEIARVLTPGGAFQFVIHAAEGAVVEAARMNVRDVEYLLNEARLFDLAAGFYEAVREVESKPAPPAPEEDRRALQAKMDFEAELAAVGKRAASCRNPEIFQYVIRSIVELHKNRGQYALEPMLGKLDAMRDAVRAHRDRLRANIDFAFDSDRLARFESLLEAAGLQVTQSEGLRDRAQGNLIGWLVAGEAGAS